MFAKFLKAAALISLAVVAGAALSVPVCYGQAYPIRPIRLLVPDGAGGATDIAARVLGEEMSRSLGQPVVVENRPGASGVVVMEAVARSAPDGYVLGMGNTGPMAILPQLEKVSYSPIGDFEVVAPLVLYEFMLVGRADMPAKSVKEVVAMARANPGKLNYGSAGKGTMPHLALEYLKTTADVDLVHVPYKGGAPVLSAIMGNQVDIALIPILAALPAVKAGKVKAFGTGGTARFPLAADIPTIAEAGIPNFEAYSWSVLLAPKGTPADVVGKLNAAANEALRTPKVRQMLIDQGITPTTGGSTADASDFVRAETQKLAATIKAGKVTGN